VLTKCFAEFLSLQRLSPQQGLPPSTRCKQSADCTRERITLLCLNNVHTFQLQPSAIRLSTFFIFY